MNIKKVFGSILLGVGNVLVFSMLPLYIINLLLYILGIEKVFNVTGLIIFLISIILNIILISKLYKKLYLNSSLQESITYSSLISLSWVVVLFILMEFFGLFQPNGFISIGMIAGIAFAINIIYISILNIIYIIKSFINDRKKLSLFLGIVIQFIIPIIYIVFCNVVSSGAFVKPYTEEEILNIINKKDNVQNSIIINTKDTNISMNCNEGTGCDIKLDEYYLEIGEFVYLIEDKGAKLYTIKTNNKVYIIGTFMGSPGIIPTKQYEILNEYTIEQYELVLKEKELIKEIEQIAKSYGYSESGNLIDFDKGDIFITKVIMRLEEYNDIVMVNWLQYSNEIDIRFNNYKDKITINLDWYIED